MTRHYFHINAVCLLLTLVLANPFPAAADDHAQKLDGFLSQGQLQAAHEHFASVAQSSPSDQVARTAQGLVEFLQALEFLGQANFRYGLMQKHAMNLPLARLPVPENPDPQALSYPQLRTVVAEFQAKLQSAEGTLAAVKTDQIKLPLYLGRVRLDLDGNNQWADEETLWRIFAAINNAVEPEQGAGFFVAVDGADVHWLRGYCHFLMAICDAILAYDQHELFERCGQLLFPKIESPYLVAQDALPQAGVFEARVIMDLIAAIHLVRFPLDEPQRLAAAHGHLLAMIEQSRRCWERASDEMDDDQEWIPNPNQTGVLQVRVSRDLITGWHRVLDELQAILEGRKLIPYWRDYVDGIFDQPQIPPRGRGINLKRVFLEPTDFDLVLTIQGSQMEPYLEEGELSTPEAWSELTQVFRGQFFGFAIWFN